MRSSPRIDDPVRSRLPAIGGQAPDIASRPSGCAFNPRCRLVHDRCTTEVPALVETAPGRRAACFATEAQVHRLTLREAPTPIDRPTRDDDPVLEVRHATLGYRVRGGWWRPARREAVVPDLDLVARRGQVLGLVGESGSGKSTAARAMVGLLAPMAGEILVEGVSWSAASAQERAHLRRTVQMVFQDPYQSLNPRQTIREILVEPLVVHRMRPADQRSDRVSELMAMCGLSSGLLDRYPYQLSGGQRQRVGIARALAVEPKLVIADEPVSALDVSVQAQVVNLLADLRDQLGIGYVLIAHDLSVVRHLCDEMAVMEQGVIVERGPAAQVFAHPQHPYTQRLLAATPGRSRSAEVTGGTAT